MLIYQAIPGGSATVSPCKIHTDFKYLVDWLFSKKAPPVDQSLDISFKVKYTVVSLKDVMNMVVSVLPNVHSVPNDWSGPMWSNMLSTSPTQLLTFKLILKTHFLSCTNHISSAQLPGVASAYYIRPHRYQTFPSLEKFYWTVWDLVKHSNPILLAQNWFLNGHVREFRPIKQTKKPVKWLLEKISSFLKKLNKRRSLFYLWKCWFKRWWKFCSHFVSMRRASLRAKPNN